MTSGQEKWSRLALISAVALGADLATKAMIQRTFYLYQQVEVIGDYLRLTHLYNPGAAFGISLGAHSRLIFAFLSFVALAALIALYASTPAGDRTRLNSIALICGGALGNLWNRILNPAGVVDWIDVGIGQTRWPVFNLADIAVTTGAILLALSLWREELEDVPAGARQRARGRQDGQ